MRAFVAIDFSSRLKDTLSELQRDFRAFTVAGRWKYIDNFHLTLKFLDEIREDKVLQVEEILKKVCTQREGFSLKVSEIGNFPGNNCFRVLWLGLAGELEKLRRLQAEIDNGLVSMGFQKEKRTFTPHITLGQDLVFNRDFEKIKEIAAGFTFPEVFVDRIYLFKSEQIERKRVYTPMSEFKFN